MRYTVRRKRYGKRPLSHLLVIYLIFVAIIYGMAYFVVSHKDSGNSSYTLDNTSQQVSNIGY